MNLQAFIDTPKFEHNRKVAKISGLLAKHLGYSFNEVELIEEASMYHDIGKYDIPPEILNKPGSLTDHEFDIVKRHAQMGSDRIADIQRILSVASVIAENHHEKWNGSGYHGLVADEIHPYARLVSVADVFDALVAKRVYRDAWDLSDVLSYLKDQAGIQFDVTVVTVLLTYADEVAALYR